MTIFKTHDLSRGFLVLVIVKNYVIIIHIKISRLLRDYLWESSSVANSSPSSELSNPFFCCQYDATDHNQMHQTFSIS